MSNNDDIKERMKQVLEAKKSNVSKITEGEDMKRSTLSAQINGNSSVSADAIRLFLRKFRDLSAKWLLFGEGLMCGTNSDSVYKLSSDKEEETKTNDNDNNTISESERVEFLKQQVADRDRLLEEKERTIQLLLKAISQ